MRLSEIRKIIEETHDLLVYDFEAYPLDGNMQIVKKMTPLLQAIEKLKDIPSLVPIINNLISVKNISSIHTDEPVFIPTNESTAFNQWLTKLKSQCSTILDLANSILPPMDENTVCVKLPDNLDVSQFNKIVDSFTYFFHSIVHSENRTGNVKMAGVEAGSDWLYFIILSPTIIPIVKQFIDLTYDILKKYVDAKESLLKLKSLSIEVEFKKDVEKYLHEFCVAGITELKNKKTIAPDSETTTRYINAIEKLAKILEAGTSIHPSLTAPSEEQSTNKLKLEQLEQEVKKLKLLESPHEIIEKSSDYEDDDVSANLAQDDNPVDV